MSRRPVILVADDSEDILDVEMPSLNGFEVCARLKSNPALARAMEYREGGLTNRVMRVGHYVQLLEQARVMALTHHERWDGTGYPKKLKGDAIPLAGRIMAVADAFEAMTATQRHRSPINVIEAGKDRAARSAASSSSACPLLDSSLAAIALPDASRKSSTSASPCRPRSTASGGYGNSRRNCSTALSAASPSSRGLNTLTGTAALAFRGRKEGTLFIVDG